MCETPKPLREGEPCPDCGATMPEAKPLLGYLDMTKTVVGYEAHPEAHGYGWTTHTVADCNGTDAPNVPEALECRSANRSVLPAEPMTARAARLGPHATIG